MAVGLGEEVDSRLLSLVGSKRLTLDTPTGAFHQPIISSTSAASLSATATEHVRDQESCYPGWETAAATGSD